MRSAVQVSPWFGRLALPAWPLGRRPLASVRWIVLPALSLSTGRLTLSATSPCAHRAAVVDVAVARDAGDVGAVLVEELEAGEALWLDFLAAAEWREDVLAAFRFGLALGALGVREVIFGDFGHF